MQNEYTDDTFLSRWLNNDLTEDELVSFKKTPEFKEYEKIVAATQHFIPPKFDKKKVFEEIRLKNSKQKVKRSIPNWIYAAAASVALLLGAVYYLTGTSDVFSTSFGEQLAVVLPDGSEVSLNSKSSITYNKSDWFDGNRTLTLNGEGYFKVKKGSTFRVCSENGIVRVLGTQFNVKSTRSYYEVSCYEGRVEVQKQEEIKVLTKGLSYRKIEANPTEIRPFKAKEPNWLSGESSFRGTPLKYVLEALEKQYDIVIDPSIVDLNVLYTGTFTNNNIHLALETICTPLAIKFRIDNKNVVLSKK